MSSLVLRDFVVWARIACCFFISFVVKFELVGPVVFALSEMTSMGCIWIVSLWNFWTNKFCLAPHPSEFSCGSGMQQRHNFALGVWCVSWNVHYIWACESYGRWLQRKQYAVSIGLLESHLARADLHVHIQSQVSKLGRALWLRQLHLTSTFAGAYLAPFHLFSSYNPNLGYHLNPHLCNHL